MERLKSHGHFRLIAVALLIAIVVIPRIISASLSVSPARDMIRYVEAAKRLHDMPVGDALRSIDCHPLYPALLLGSQRLLVRNLGFDGPESWVVAGEILGITTYTLFALAALGYGSQVVGFSLAWWGCVLFTTLPRQVAYSVDVLTDSLHSLFWMLSFWALAGMHGRRSVSNYIIAGLLASGAYLTRAEGLMIPLCVFATIAMAQIVPQWRLPWKHAVTLLLAFAAGFAGPSLGYMATLGRISPRNSASAILGLPTVAEPRITPTGNAVVNLPAVSSSEIPDTPPGKRPVIVDREYRRNEAYEYSSFGDAARALLYEIAQETRVWLLPFLIMGLCWLPRSSVPMPVGLFPGMAWLGFAVLLVILKMKCGYIVGRYLMPMIPTVGFLAAMGMARLPETLALLPFRWTMGTNIRAQAIRLYSVIALVGLAVCVPTWFRSSHRHRASYMEAAHWLRNHTEPGELVFDPIGLVSFFAERPTWHPTDLHAPIRARFAVIDSDRVYRTDPISHAMIKRYSEHGVPAKHFVQEKGRRTNVLYLYEWKAPMAHKEIPSGIR